MALTSAQIVALACQVAKVPGYTSQAGQYLNLVLSQLAQTYDFDFYTSQQILTIGPSATNRFDLNADHLRTREAFYNVSGQPFYMTQMDIRRYNQLYLAPGLNDYPKNFAIDVAATPMVFLPYVPPVISLNVTINYYPTHADIATPETSNTIPWFPQQNYLIKSVASLLLDIADDDERKAKLDKDREDILSKFLIMDDDKEGYPQQLKFDRNTFKTGSSLKPTKSQPL